MLSNLKIPAHGRVRHSVRAVTGFTTNGDAQSLQRLDINKDASLKSCQSCQKFRRRPVRYHRLPGLSRISSISRFKFPLFVLVAAPPRCVSA